MFELTRPAWQRLARCRDADVQEAIATGAVSFFPRRGAPVAPAREVCAGCPVRGECAEAGKVEQFGIWGGTTLRQRRRLRVGSAQGAGRPRVSQADVLEASAVARGVGEGDVVAAAAFLLDVDAATIVVLMGGNGDRREAS